MTPAGPGGFRRLPDGVRRQLDVAAAAAWSALVEVHTAHALRFVALMAGRLDFDDALLRYLDELDIRDPMASAVRTRVLMDFRQAASADSPRPSIPGVERAEIEADEEDAEGIARFRPDRLFEGIARKVRESEAHGQWVALAVARAEEAVIRAHVDNALVFAAILDEDRPLSDAVEDYLEVMRVSGGRSQSIHQRAMARLADDRLPGETPAG